MHFLRRFLLLVSSLCLAVSLRADDGYRLWLRYDRLEGAAPVDRIVLTTPAGTESPVLAAARDELVRGLTGLTGVTPVVALESSAPNPALGAEGYHLSRLEREGRTALGITAHDDHGILYGAFALLRHIQQGLPLEGLNVTSAPKIQRRLLNHWDDLNRHVERGYAGFSLWEWFYLPEDINPRYRDYARACASIGINGTVLTNVNANAQVLTPAYLAKVRALAGVFRPYGVRVYLTARFSAPIELGGLKTADPLDPAVQAWWQAKIDEIYQYIPDFGGFLVKANSEGQPGPQDYKRTHADGANLLADALAPHGGIVMWRAFVYSPDNRDDRVKQAYTEFVPLDGKFRDNVIVQVKNGPLDFMPREPFSPVFGAMPKTPLAIELQATQEYLGQGVQLAYLAPLWKEVLDADTHVRGAGSTVARIVDGSLEAHRISVIAGVANIGTDRNWTGQFLGQANWYAYGRLAWDHQLDSRAIAAEWTRLTFGGNTRNNQAITELLMGSRETVVNYSMPLGLHHIMAEGHHYGPGPWVDKLGRADWTSVYYHRADAKGLGFDRTPAGSKAIGQYAPELQQLWGNLQTCPENLLLWFHHVPWDHRMKSGRTLWDELALRYQQGVDEVAAMRRTWAGLEGIDREIFDHVAGRLQKQETDAREWRDACLLYFQQFSKLPLPAGVEPPARTLEDYKKVNRRNMPGYTR